MVIETFQVLNRFWAVWSFGKTSGTSFARQIFDEENSNTEFGQSRPKKGAFCVNPHTPDRFTA